MADETYRLRVAVTDNNRTPPTYVDLTIKTVDGVLSGLEASGGGQEYNSFLILKETGSMLASQAGTFGEEQGCIVCDADGVCHNVTPCPF